MTTYERDAIDILDKCSEQEDLYDYMNLLHDLLKEIESRLSLLNQGLNPYEKYSLL